MYPRLVIQYRMLIAMFLFVGLAAAALGSQGGTSPSDLDDLVLVEPILRVSAVSRPCESLSDYGRREAVARFIREDGGGPALPLCYVDERSGRPAILFLSGIPWISGPADLGELEATARAFVDRHQELLGVPSSDLVLNPDASGPVAAGRYWLVDFDWVPHGVKVEYAHLVFRVSHGNLVQVGMEHIGDSSDVPSMPALTEQHASGILASHLNISPTFHESLIEPPALRVFPADPEGSWSIGNGFDYRLVWNFTFRQPRLVGTWNGGVDAISGEVLYFRDLNLYPTVKGKVRPSNRNNPVTRPFPFADYRESPTQFADENGVYPNTTYPRSRLQGQFVAAFSGCGGILNETPLGTGLDFGGGLLEDCASAETLHGLGNTNAARTTYYHLSEIKKRLAGYLPGNAWLNSRLTGTTDNFGSCNAFWDGGAVNFFQGGGLDDCWNFGEIDSIIYHEFGHGLDQNDGTGIHGTTEGYADIVALLTTRESCIGKGAGMPCGRDMGYTCFTGCDGLRQADWTARVGNPRTPERTCNECPTFGTLGPCGREIHCEAAVPSEAIWDLATEGLPLLGLTSEEAWDLTETLWYRSVATITTMYSCDGCPASGAGAGAGTLYAALMLFDDCDGNLMNGTPHAPAIYSALARHGIAAGSARSPQNQTQTCGGSPPSATITSPQDGATVSGTMTIQASASDNVAVDRVEFYVDDFLLSTDATAPYSASWNTEDETDGFHTLLARAFDNEGAMGDSPVVSVAVDNAGSPPTVEISSPPEGAVVTGTVTIRASASDADGSVQRVEFFVDGSLLATDPTWPYQADWNTASLPPNSQHLLRAVAYDDDGLSGEDTVTVTANPDGSDPAVTIVEPLDGQIVGVNVTICAEVIHDDLIERVEFFWDGQSIGSDFGPPTWCRGIGTSGDPDGTQHSAYAVAYDIDGDSGMSQTVTVTVDALAPTVEIVSPADGDTVSGAIIVEASAADNTGVERVEFRVDGGTRHTDSSGPPWTYTLDSTLFDNGGHTLQALARDVVGRVGLGPAITVTVDNPSGVPLIAHYPLDGDADDALGNNDGILEGFPPAPFIDDNPVGSGALRFDGGNDRVAIQNMHYDSTGLEAVSVSAWVRTSDGSRQIIASFDRSEYWRLEIDGPGGGFGRIGWDVRTASGIVDFGSVGRVDTCQWHHVVGVFDGADREMRIYIDGQLDNSRAVASNTFGTGVTRFGFLGVGSEATAAGGARNANTYFQGDLDDVWIFDRAVSAAEVQALYEQGDPTPAPCPPEIRLELSDGTPVPDGGNYDFGTWNVEDLPTSREFNLCNDGTGELVIDNPTSMVSGTGFSQIVDPVTPVAPGTCTSFRVRFHVASPGSRTGAVTIQDNDADEDPYNITLLGNATSNPPDLCVEMDGSLVSDGATWDFGTAPPNTNAAEFVRLKNCGVADLVITQVPITGTNPGNFHVGSSFLNLLPLTLSPGAQQSMWVAMRGVAPGPRSALLTIHSNDPPDGTFELALVGAIE